MANKQQAKCRELPEEAITYILSELEDARYVAQASTVSKSWNRASMSVTKLNFYGHGQARDWCRMIRARLSTLESLTLIFQSAEEIEHCLSLAGVCERLSSLSLGLRFGYPTSEMLRKVFTILASFPRLAALRVEGYLSGSGSGLGALEGLSFKAVKVLTLLVREVNVKPVSKEVWSAFPALEDLTYVRNEGMDDRPSPIPSIESETLQRLNVSAMSDYFHVKAPKLTSVGISCVRKVHCEAAPVVSVFNVYAATEVISDAQHVSLLVLECPYGALDWIEFPKLTSLQTLDYRGHSELLHELPEAALSCVETARLDFIHALDGPDAYYLLNTMKRLKSIAFASSLVVNGRLPAVCFSELKTIHYALWSSQDFSLLCFVVENAPSLEVIEVDRCCPGLEDEQLRRMLHRLLQPRRSKPKLIIEGKV